MAVACTTEVPVTREVPVTVLSDPVRVTRLVEVTREVPITELVVRTVSVPMTRERIVEVTREVPVTRVVVHTREVPVTTAPTATRVPTATPSPTATRVPTSTPTRTPSPTSTPAPKSSREVPFIYDEAYNAGVNDAAVELMRADMLKMINSVRANQGLPRVVLGSNTSPQAHAEYLRDGCIVSHTGSGGSDKRDRWTDAGGNANVRLAENVNGYRDCSFTVPNARTLHYYVQKLMDSLINSSGHRDIMLTPAYDEVHLGFAISPNGMWVTQLFVDTAGAASSQIATATPSVSKVRVLSPTPKPTATPTPRPTPRPTATPRAVRTPTSSRNISFVYNRRYGAGVNQAALDAMKADMLGMINRERRRAGVPPVVLGNISSVQEHTEYMRDNCIVSNSGRGGVSKNTLWARAGGASNVGLAQNVNGYRTCTFTVPSSRTLYYYVEKLMSSLLRNSVATGIIVKETYDEVHLGFAISPNGMWVTQLFVDRR